MNKTRGEKAGERQRERQRERDREAEGGGETGRVVVVTYIDVRAIDDSPSVLTRQYRARLSSSLTP